MQGPRDDVSQIDLVNTAEIQAGIRGSFERYEVPPAIRVMALFSLLVETFGKIDWLSDEESQQKARRDMDRMGGRRGGLARTEPGTMRLEQIRSAAVVGVERAS